MHLGAARVDCFSAVSVVSKPATAACQKLWQCITRLYNELLHGVDVRSILLHSLVADYDPEYVHVSPSSSQWIATGLILLHSGVTIVILMNPYIYDVVTPIISKWIGWSK